MSGQLLKDPSWRMDIPDDLEALFYVMLFHAVLRIPNNCEGQHSFMTRFFDRSYEERGLLKRGVMSWGYIPLLSTECYGRTILQFQTDWNKIWIPSGPAVRPINAFFTDIMEMFRKFYLHRDERPPIKRRKKAPLTMRKRSAAMRPVPWRTTNALLKLQLRNIANHANFEKILRRHLNLLEDTPDAETDDPAQTVDQPAPSPPTNGKGKAQAPSGPSGRNTRGAAGPSRSKKRPRTSGDDNDDAELPSRDEEAGPSNAGAEKDSRPRRKRARRK